MFKGKFPRPIPDAVDLDVAIITFSLNRPAAKAPGHLWVKLPSQPPGKIHVSHGEPGTVADGDLWVRTYAFLGDSSTWTVARSGKIYVSQQTPTVVTLRKDGMWTGVEAWLWDGTQWLLVSVADYLYNEGIEFLGGWVPGYSDGGGSQSKEPDHLYLTVPLSIAGQKTWVTDLPVNLTGVSQVMFDCSWNVGLYNNFYLGAALNKMSASDFAVRLQYTVSTSPRTEVGLNVANLTGAYYIKISIMGPGDGDGTARIYKVWLVY